MSGMKISASCRRDLPLITVFGNFFHVSGRHLEVLLKYLYMLSGLSYQVQI